MAFGQYLPVEGFPEARLSPFPSMVCEPDFGTPFFPHCELAAVL